MLKTLKASMVASDRLAVQAAPQHITKEYLGKASVEENVAPPDDPIIQDPTTEIDLSIVLACSIPAPGDQAKFTKKGVAVLSDAANSYKKYKESPQLNRICGMRKPFPSLKPVHPCKK
ncbi:hypothetical protein HDU77_007903 [Chytriomyces hyalinus]|nr:hypothetical protein HDU77_007903 [Chytriomyces hyalinus]